MDSTKERLTVIVFWDASHDHIYKSMIWCIIFGNAESKLRHQRQCNTTFSPKHTLGVSNTLSPITTSQIPYSTGDVDPKITDQSIL